MFRIFSVGFVVLFSQLLQAQETQIKIDIKQQAIAFITAEEGRAQPTSTMADIDKLLALYADEFVEVHAKAKITITDKAELRKGMAEKLKDKVYYLNTTIDEMLVVGNSVALKLSTAAKVQPSWTDRTFESTSTQLITLEFDERGLLKYRRIY